MSIPPAYPSRPPALPRRRVRTGHFIVGVFAAFAALVAIIVALFYAIENAKGRRAFAAVADEAKAAGLSLSLQDLAPPPVPDARNLAKLSLLDHPPKEDPETPFWTDLKKRLALQVPGDAPPRELPRREIPSVFEDLPADLPALRAEIRALSESAGAEDLDTYLARLAPLLAELADEVTARPHLRYEHDWRAPYAITVPHIGVVRALGIAATHLALVDLESERPAAAARALSVPLGFASAIRAEPTIVSQLTAYAVGGRAIHHIWQGQIGGQWTASELALFADALADDEVLAGFRRAFAAEAAGGVTTSLQFADGVPSACEAFVLLIDNPQLRRLLRWGPSGWLQQNAARIGRFALDESLPSIDLATARVHPEKIVTRGGEFSGPLPHTLIARVVTPSLGAVVRSSGQAKTAHDLARLAVALEQHRLAHSAYPESLAPVIAAAPALAALHDPFDGRPYRYRRDADGGFTLWGVGRNLRDDGGAFPEKQTDRPDYATGDLVWRVPGR